MERFTASGMSLKAHQMQNMNNDLGQCHFVLNSRAPGPKFQKMSQGANKLALLKN